MPRGVAAGDLCLSSNTSAGTSPIPFSNNSLITFNHSGSSNSNHQQNVDCQQLPKSASNSPKATGKLSGGKTAAIMRTSKSFNRLRGLSPNPMGPRKHSSNNHAISSRGWQPLPKTDANASNESGNNVSPEPIMGFINKRKRFQFKGWHMRFFYMSQGILAWAKDEYSVKSVLDSQEREFIGMVDLETAEVHFNRAQSRINIDCNAVVHHLRFKNSHVFQGWLDSLGKHMTYRMRCNAVSLGTFTRELSFNSVDIDARYLSDLPRIDQRKMMMTAVPTQCNPKMIATGNEPVNGDRLQELIVGMESVLGKMRDCTDTTSPERDLQVALIKSNSSVAVHLSPSTSSERLSANELDQPRSAGKLRKKLSNIRNHKWHPVTTEITREVTELEASAKVFINLAEEYLRLVREHQRAETDSMQAQWIDLVTRNQQLERVFKSIGDQVNAMLKDTKSNTLDSHATLTSNKQKGSIRWFKQAGSFAISSSEDEGDELFHDALEQAKNSEEENSDEVDLSDCESELQSRPRKPIDMAATLRRRRESLAVVLASRNLHGRRTILPAPQPDCSDFSLVNMLYKNIGRDLSKISMPVKLNEPLSALQRLCEEMEYSHLLDRAANEPDPGMRMSLVAAFAVSIYAYTSHRASTKPFNPLLCETYELVQPDYQWKFVAEQVTHHPPGAMSNCQGRKWTLEQHFVLKNKFWGKSIEAFSLGGIRLTLRGVAPGEVYTWTKVTSCISNLMSTPQKRTIDIYGDCLISCKQNQHQCKLRFHKDAHNVTGTVLNDRGLVLQALSGKWNESFGLEGLQEAPLWQMKPMPGQAASFYGFTQFAIELNELAAEEEKSHLPRTDCRFRPDQRALENGELDLAEEEKCLLEENQRKRREQNLCVKPRWFNQCPEQDGIGYTFSGQYWHCKEVGQFASMDLPKLW